MTALAVGGDSWKITPEERTKHDTQFHQLKPVNGYVTGNQARNFFLQSGLPMPVLGQIWTLADMNADGKMDKKEFSIAMYLIQKKLQGHELPKMLPQGLKADPVAAGGFGGGMMYGGGGGGGGGGFGGGGNNNSSFASFASPSPSQSSFSSASNTSVNTLSHVTMHNGGSMSWSTTQSLPQYQQNTGYHVGGSGSGGIPVAGFAAAGASTMPSPASSFTPTKAGAAAEGDWAVPQNQKLKFTQQFNMQDRQRKGFLTGVEARQILVQTGLPQNTLAQIWSLSDLDNDGKLSCEEFVLAMHMVEISRQGQALPVKLPPDLVPPRFRKTPLATVGSAVGLPPTMPPQQQPGGAPSSTSVASDAFGDLLGSSFSSLGGASTTTLVPLGSSISQAGAADPAATESDILQAVTFEDKRKANFDKGQAELDKRRAALKEQQVKEEEARRAKEREEHEKRERKRLEQEMKKQQELERQMERQRQQEAEREEQRRKAMEQKEAARREMERQRQLEWERQRRDQLMTDKQREQMLVDQLHSQVSKLKIDLEAMDTKKVDSAHRVQQARTNVMEITSSIDNMRSSRDSKLADIEKCQAQIQEWTLKVNGVEQERMKLDSEVQAIAGAYDHNYKAVLHSHSSKKQNITALKEQMQKIQQETEAKQKEIDETNSQLNELKEKLEAIKGTHNKLQAERTEKKLAWLKKKGVPTPPQEEKPQNGKASDWFGGGSSSSFDQQPASNQWGTSSSNQDNWASQDGRKSEPKSLDDMWSDFGKKDLFSSTKSADPFANHSKSADLFASRNESSASPAQAANLWADDFFTSPAVATKAKSKGAETERPGYKKYQGLYQFDARNEDELSFMPGDTVWVKDDQTGTEPDWLAGERDGKEGVFPAAYAGVVEEESKPSNGFSQSSAFDSGAGGQDNFFASSFDQAASTEQQQPAVDSPASVLTASVDSSFTAVAPASSTESPDTTASSQQVASGTQALALFPWRAKNDNHLSFDKGDVILIKEQQDMWYLGELNGQTGWFPKSQVKFIGSATPVSSASAEAVQSPVAETTPQQPAAAVTQVTPSAGGGGGGGENHVAVYTYSSTEPGDLTFAQGEVIRVTSTENEGDWWKGEVPGTDRKGIFPASYVKKMETSSKLGTSTKKPEIATVIAAYQGTSQEQLTLSPGQLVQVRKKSASGWWEGELQARGQKRKIGWFPANYVKLLGPGSSARSTPDAMAGPRSSTPQQTLSASPAPGDSSSRSATPVSYPAPTVAPAVEQVVALYSYTAQNDDEMSFAKDSVINVVDNSDPDWWKGELNGQTGLFPSNYVSKLTDQSQQQPQQQSYDGGPMSPMSPELADMEKRRQNLIKELIDSEEQYVTALGTAKDVFYVPMKREGTLTHEELDAIFVNWKEIRMCNVKMLKAFRVRKRMCQGHYIHSIGDLLCAFLPHMSLYVRYCSCQLNAAALIQRKTENNPKFKEMHNKCLSDPRTGGMPISSFLLKPMQRITKYPMLIQKILEYTPLEHSDRQPLEDALARAQEICNQVNEGVRETENSDRLEWIQAHVQCDGLSEKLTYNSVTNSLGPRKILYTGSLYKTKSGKELVGFLFNDFLLLTQPQRSLGDMASIFSFDIKANTQFKMYRTPLFLNELSVARSPEDQSNDAFHVTHQDKTFSLRAISHAEREAWVKKTELASKHYLEVERKKREKANQAKQAASRQSVGRLILIVVEGFHLIRGDENGKSDPYCEVSMGAQEVKTAVVPNNLNPKWNASMQFTVRDLKQDVLCLTVYDRDLFTPDDFLGRTEIRMADIYKESQQRMGPISKRLKLLEVDSGEVVVKLTLQLFNKT